MLKKLGLLSIAAASLMAMHEFNININDVDLEAGVKLDMGQFNDAVEPNTTFIGVKFLNADKDYSDFSSPDAYFEANFLMQREINNSGFFAGIGIKLNYNGSANQDFMALPLGLKLGYTLPSTVIPIYFSGEAYYAPQVLSMQDAKSYYEYRLNCDIEIIQNALINIGFRDLEFKYDGNSEYIKYNRSGYIGFKFRF